MRNNFDVIIVIKTQKSLEKLPIFGLTSESADAKNGGDGFCLDYSGINIVVVPAIMLIPTFLKI